MTCVFFLNLIKTSQSLFWFFCVTRTDVMVEQVPESINFPSEEEKILQFWKEKDCFQECLRQSKNRTRWFKVDTTVF